MTVCESHSLVRGKHFADKQAEKDLRLAFSHGKPAGAVWKTVGILFALFLLQVCWGGNDPISHLLLFSFPLEFMQ